MRSKSLFFLLLTVLVLAATGCNDKVTVRGKVTLSDDQSPLTVGTVVFQTNTFQARATLNPDGTYLMGTLSDKDGIPKGTYQVTINGAVEPVGGDASKFIVPKMQPLIVPLKDMTVVVDGKQKEYDIVVDRAK